MFPNAYINKYINSLLLVKMRTVCWWINAAEPPLTWRTHSKTRLNTKKLWGLNRLM